MSKKGFEIYIETLHMASLFFPVKRSAWKNELIMGVLRLSLATHVKTGVNIQTDHIIHQMASFNGDIMIPVKNYSVIIF